MQVAAIAREPNYALDSPYVSQTGPDASNANEADPRPALSCKSSVVATLVMLVLLSLSLALVFFLVF